MADNTAVNTIEYLDVVDQNNIIIGRETRQNIHTNNLYHRSAHIIISYKNFVFLQLRSASKQQFPNKWDSSAAGHLIAGEDYATCALRELEEELGIKNSEPVEIANIPASTHTGFEFIKIYTIKLQSLPNIILESSEITAGGWFSCNHITNWLNINPDSFAGCFDLIWDKYISYYNTANC